MHLNIIPYSQTYYDQWLDLQAIFSVKFFEFHRIKSEVPELSEQGLHLIAIDEKERLLGSLVVDSHNNSKAVKNWSVLPEIGKEVLFKLISESLAIINEELFLSVNNSEYIKFLKNEGAEVKGEETVFYLKGDFTEEFSNRGEFCDHYLCYANNDKFRTIFDSQHIVNKEFMAPIKKQVLKFYLK